MFVGALVGQLSVFRLGIVHSWNFILIVLNHIAISAARVPFGFQLLAAVAVRAFLSVPMGGASSVTLKKKHGFLAMKDEEGTGAVKRVIREDDGGITRIPVKTAFFQISDITTVSQKQDENDVLLTLSNGVEYCLDGLDEPGEVYDTIITVVYKDEEDDDADDWSEAISMPETVWWWIDSLVRVLSDVKKLYCNSNMVLAEHVILCAVCAALFLAGGFCVALVQYHLQEALPFLCRTMGGAGSIEIKKKGEFIQIKDEDGTGIVKRIIRLEDGKHKVPVKKVFMKISDITTVSQKLEENDVILTLKNEAEYCLDGVDEPDEIRKTICKKMIQDEDDD